MLRKLLALFVVAVVVVAAGATAAWWFLLRGGANYPDKWDPRVVPLVHIVEQYRGLTFKHPIYVDFLSVDAFKKQVGDDGKLSADDKKAIARSEGIARALGLIGGDVDLLAATDALAKSGVDGLYDFKDKRIRVRGSDLTDSVKVTLVHELTHALQDQTFSISDREAKLADDPLVDGDAYRALYEGDAVRIEDKYRQLLPDSVQQALDKQDEADGASFKNDTKNVPPVLQAEFGAPYALGGILVGRAQDQGGNGRVDDMFNTPPTRILQVMDPWLAGQAWNGPKVDFPKLAADEKEQEKSTYGAFGLYLTLAQRLPLTQALQVADGWGGDAEIDYTHGETSCLKVAFVGKGASETAALTSALQQWAAGTGGVVAVTAADGHVLMQGCDPGKGAKAPADNSDAAMQFLTNRNGIEADTEKEGGTQSEAICFANALVANFSNDELGQFNQSEPTDAQKQRIRTLATGCRAQG